VCTAILLAARTNTRVLPRLLLDEIDLLIIDQIGKEVSGTGMDTNIIGRDIAGYSTSLNQRSSEVPQMARIFVRVLSHETNGNGIGIGLADFTTNRAVKALNLHRMYTNALTSIGLQTAKIPIQFETDREAIRGALEPLGSLNPEKVHIVRIINTLSLERSLVSESCVDALAGRPGVIALGMAKDMQFDGIGNLLLF
jgi:hypothetical protein